jgi:hypothetical protein
VRLWDLVSGVCLRVLADFNAPGLATCVVAVAADRRRVVWRIQCSADVLACAVGEQNNNHSSKMVVFDMFAASLHASEPQAMDAASP